MPVPPVVVLDSNVFVAALLNSASCRAILAAWRRGAFNVAVSSELLDELHRVLARSKFHARVSQADISELLAFIDATAFRVTPITLSHQISRDRSDDRVFACALAAGAACVVSGDADVLSVPSIADLRICSPRSFLAWFASR